MTRYIGDVVERSYAAVDHVGVNSEALVCDLIVCELRCAGEGDEVTGSEEDDICTVCCCCPRPRGRHVETDRDLARVSTDVPHLRESDGASTSNFLATLPRGVKTS